MTKAKFGSWACLWVALGPPTGGLLVKIGLALEICAHVQEGCVSLMLGRFCKIGAPPRGEAHCWSLGLSLVESRAPVWGPLFGPNSPTQR